MKTRNFIIMFVVFISFGVILFLFDQNIAAYISLGFATMLGVTFLTSKILDNKKLKKLDSKYYVLTKEELLKEYNKLSKEFEEGKLKQIILTYLVFKEEYDDVTLKRFGLWLTKNYPVDPSGIDKDIIILFVNIHELMMKELIKDIKQKLKEQQILVDFKYGYSIYKKNDDYEQLKTRAINNIHK